VESSSEQSIIPPIHSKERIGEPSTDLPTSGSNEPKVIDSAHSEERPEKPVPSEERTAEHTCGQCGCWHKPSCSYPDAEPSCVSPLNKHAVDCKDFQEKPE